MFSLSVSPLSRSSPLSPLSLSPPSLPPPSLSNEEAAALEAELLGEYRFGPQQLMEIWGHACAIAITKVCVLFFFL